MQTDMNLRGIDLNLLTVFDSIMTEGNLSRAAEKLGMSQPAMSNALSRLRAALDDQLFVRTAQGMAPTPRARLLARPVRQALDLIQAGLRTRRPGETFDASSSTRSFVISVEDYGETVIMPRFMDWLMQTAPGVRIRIRPQPGKTLARKLREGSIAFATRHVALHDSEVHTQHLLNEDFVSMVRQDHPTVGDTLSLAQYLSLPHVVFGRLGRRGIRNSIVDTELRRLGLKRKIALQVPGFQSMPAIVRNTNFICTMPRRMAQVYADHFRLKTLKTPIDLPPLPVYLVWSKSMDSDPEHEWLRKSFCEICQRL
jgi:DNA-binding transcriptional LysR family regulator